VNKYSLTTATCQQRWWTNWIHFLSVEQRTVGCLVLNQSQQSSSPYFAQSANHGICRPSLLVADGGYHLQRLVVTLWCQLLCCVKQRITNSFVDGHVSSRGICVAAVVSYWKVSRLPYYLYCVGRDVKHCSIQSNTERFLAGLLPLCQLVICCGAGVRLSYMYWMTSILVSGTYWCTLIDETRQWQRVCLEAVF